MSKEKYYDMEEQRRMEEKYAPIVMDLLERKFGEEPKDVRDEHKDFDFRCVGFTFGLKADSVIAETKNLFIETLSVAQDTELRKKGWLYSQECDYVIYLDTHNLRLLLLPLKPLQQYERFIKSFPRGWAQNKDRVSIRHLVPMRIIFLWLYGSFGIDWVELEEN
ncbi:hypothetical protein CH330_01550 [candidate division WOR-3 bacterium JGI_Cruoil_03_51_56]|uniref:Uncharacterized protein n=1 Tax=candidate division WOR-3 bacterium JGI_Cruoil_03_51_56 TaxID=1973747 RepID=A0A235BXN0_UNCW3|nr:MAG: hypothetical protein CH330_01550 [candidate division WOR-3 bacterium JGI_Cruoil_03_51_56]